jgi:hypothetical protein
LVENSFQELARQALILVRDHGSVHAAAKASGIARSTLRNRLARADEVGAIAPHHPSATLDIPVAPDPNEPIADLIARKKAQFERDEAARAFHQLVRIGVKQPGPVIIAAIGDPHVDDDRCDIGRLISDMETIGRTQGMYALHLGDITNNWVGRLGRLYAHQSTRATDGVRLAEEIFKIAPPLALVSGNHDCLSEDTEALTRRGWLRNDEIRDDDEVLQFVPETGACEWGPILARVNRRHEGEMVQIKSPDVDAIVTPGHRVLLRADGGWEYRTADNLPAKFAVASTDGRTTVVRAGRDVSRVPYAGQVWCLTVDNSNFLVRRNGFEHFTGNCWNEGMNWLNFCLKQATVDAGMVQAHGVRIELGFPGKKSLRIHARHDFPGHSQYNANHGLQKEHLFGKRDHINIAGHRHISSVTGSPSPDGYVHWTFRVEGYKVYDDYAHSANLQEKRMGPTVGLLIDVNAKHPAEVVKPYWDLEAAADYLKFLRRKAA